MTDQRRQSRLLLLVMVLLGLLQSIALGGLITQSGPRHFSSSSGGGSFTPEYYIDDAGSDSNDGLTTSTPWAITALNTKRATYAGSVVALMDGAYDLSGMNAYDGATGDSASPILNIAAGTDGDPTVITAQTCRGATLQLTAGGGTRKGLPAIGQGPGGGQYGYVTLDCLRITGGRHWQVIFWGQNKDSRATWAPGITVQNSHFSDNVYAGEDNNPAIMLNDVIGPVVSNNWFEDILDTGAGYGPTTVMTLSVRGLTLEYNTAINTRTLLHDKHNDAPSYANDAFTVRCNRAEDLTHPAIVGMDTEYEAQSPADDYQASAVYGNLFVNTQGIWSIKGSSPTRMSVSVHHNTHVMQSNIEGGVQVGLSDTTSDVIDFHSNILETGGFSTGEYDYLAISTGALGTLNWNAYDTGSFAAYIASPIGTFDGTTSYSASGSLSAWRTATGQEANSIQADCALDAEYEPTNAACIASAQNGTNMGHTGSSCTRVGADWTP